MELHERVNAIKMKVLDVIESRVTNDASLEELQHITFSLNNIDEDKNFLSKLVAGQGFGGFNGSSPKFPKQRPRNNPTEQTLLSGEVFFMPTADTSRSVVSVK